MFSTFFTDCPRKTGKSGKVVPVTASLTSHGLPQKIPLYRLFRFFSRTLQKMSRLSVCRCPAAAVPHVYPETAPLAPTVARVFLLPCRAPCVPSRLPRKKCRPPLPKLPPRTLFEWPNFAQMHRPRIAHYTNDALEFPWHVACKSQKFNSLFNFKNLKRRYLYAMTLH